ncbi:MAG TPA: hypothetical protein VFI33_09630 [Puia sp.]|nr:hypothetical protein [Puia sp.]
MFKFQIILTISCWMLASCHPDKYYTLFKIKNNSDKPIYYTYSNKYPDTSVDHSIYIPPGSTRTPGEIINPNSNLSIVKSAPIEDYFKTIPSDTIEIFIYDANVVKSSPWDSVVTKYLILKRYDLTLDNINKMDRIIVYP